MLVLDAAFSLATQSPPLGEAGVKNKLQQAFPEMSSDEIAEVYLRVIALLRGCYDEGDQCRDKKMTDAQAIASLRQRFPGFSAKNYKYALGWGYFLSR